MGFTKELGKYMQTQIRDNIFNEEKKKKQRSNDQNYKSDQLIGGRRKSV